MESLQTNGTSDASISQPDAAQVRAYLDTLFASPEFAASGRKNQLLRYLVEQTLAGHADRITEYGIGLDVFERPASFDPRTDSVVRAEVSRLRGKLRDYYETGGASDPIIIEVPQRGYVPRFTIRAAQPAEPLAAEERPASEPHFKMAWQVAALAGLVAIAALAGVAYWKSRNSPGPLKSLVVLPFENYSKDAQNDYLADGLTEELTNQLAQWRELRVVARTSAFMFKGKGADVREIGRQLNVDAVLEGSCVRQADRLKITAQLSRAADGFHLWSRSFEARSDDMLAVQDEMAQAIAAAVHGVGRDTPAPASTLATSNPEAHDLYLRASHLYSEGTPESVKKGLELLRTAVKLDPGYARAYILIERGEVALVHFTAESPKDGIERAKAALDSALQLNPRSADAHGEMANLEYTYDWDWPRAEREFQLAIAQDARAGTFSFYGWSLATRGRFDEAQREIHISEELDPVGMGPRFNKAMAYYLAHRYPDAQRAFQSMLDANPKQPDAHILLGAIAIVQGNCGGAEDQFQTAARMYRAPVTQIGLAFVSACQGDHASAHAHLAEAEKIGGFVSPYQLAMAHALLKENDSAVSWLEKSAEAKEGQILYLKYEPFFDGIRSDPRYIALEKRVGLE
jgi:TolB-like protein/Flp pilus assembly protein TadD